MRPRTILATIALTARVAAAQSAPPALYDNLGTLTHRISTAVPATQRYFDQGLRLKYAFGNAEAIRAFREGARRDPACAMCWWGVALTFGPYINEEMDSTAGVQAYAAIQKAESLATGATETERAWIAALARRYAAVPTREDRAGLDSAYADAMRDLMRRYPADLDAATFFAEAMMDLRPWHQWTPDGQPEPGTLEVVATLEDVIRRDPNHPGACHYYIHAVEASREAQRAIPCADRLGGLMPGASHLVHMPGHIYLRVGRYADAVRVNQHAVHVDHDFVEGRRPPGIYPPHNLHFLWAAASMDGQSRVAIQAARDLAATAPSYVPAAVPITLARFGQWDAVLAESLPAGAGPYPRAVWQYARGLASLRLDRNDAARSALDGLRTALAATPDSARTGGHPTKDLLRIAVGMLGGEIAARERRTDEAVAMLEDAVRADDGLDYDEPRPWYMPPRQALGAILLEAGRAAEAEAVYREDLVRNPENGWSFLGLARSLDARSRQAEAREAEGWFRRAWARADVRLTSSRF